MKPTLLVLAAGMGSRYGSLKQMDGVGPNNEAIIDYSIYDAIRAGFGKVVFVIRHDFEADFKDVFNVERFGGEIAVDYVFQELSYLPDGFSVPEGRTKPWGTNHAVMMAAHVINEPFAVINADDFYGNGAFDVIGEYLHKMDGRSNQYCMVGYRLGNTLSDFGSVSRGVCTVDADNNLTSMNERTSISRADDGVVYYEENGAKFPLSDDDTVSMNFFGFTPDYFAYSCEFFKEFLRTRSSELKAEFFIPLMVNDLISKGEASMKVLPTDSKWFGVTYKEDKPDVVAKIKALIDAGVYPEKLWK
jgi:dTDP-glucose pyrophosphorylase